MAALREGGILLAKIHQVAGRVFAKKLKEYGIEINPSQGRILFVLWENDNIPIIELSRKTMLEKSTLTSMLDRLEEMGYIKRIPSKEDRRKIIIQRTEKDRSLQELYNKVSLEMTSIFYKGLNSREIDVFENNLKHIIDNLLLHDGGEE
jgi:MarR family transcriptional regulator, organic hydroperoxide resistance regulator